MSDQEYASQLSTVSIGSDEVFTEASSNQDISSPEDGTSNGEKTKLTLDVNRESVLDSVLEEECEVLSSDTSGSYILRHSDSDSHWNISEEDTDNDVSTDEDNDDADDVDGDADRLTLTFPSTSSSKTMTSESDDIVPLGDAQDMLVFAENADDIVPLDDAQDMLVFTENANVLIGSNRVNLDVCNNKEEDELESRGIEQEAGDPETSHNTDDTGSIEDASYQNKDTSKGARIEDKTDGTTQDHCVGEGHGISNDNIEDNIASVAATTLDSVPSEDIDLSSQKMDCTDSAVEPSDLVPDCTSISTDCILEKSTEGMDITVDDVPLHTASSDGESDAKESEEILEDTDATLHLKAHILVQEVLDSAMGELAQDLCDTSVNDGPTTTCVEVTDIDDEDGEKLSEVLTDIVTDESQYVSVMEEHLADIKEEGSEGHLSDTATDSVSTAAEMPLSSSQMSTIPSDAYSNYSDGTYRPDGDSSLNVESDEKLPVLDPLCPEYDPVADKILVTDMDADFDFCCCPDCLQQPSLIHNRELTQSTCPQHRHKIPAEPSSSEVHDLLSETFEAALDSPDIDYPKDLLVVDIDRRRLESLHSELSDVEEDVMEEMRMEMEMKAAETIATQLPGQQVTDLDIDTSPTQTIDSETPAVDGSEYQEGSVVTTEIDDPSVEVDDAGDQDTKPDDGALHSPSIEICDVDASSEKSAEKNDIHQDGEGAIKDNQYDDKTIECADESVELSHGAVVSELPVITSESVTVSELTETSVQDLKSNDEQSAAGDQDSQSPDVDAPGTESVPVKPVGEPNVDNGHEEPQVTLRHQEAELRNTLYGSSDSLGSNNRNSYIDVNEFGSTDSLNLSSQKKYSAENLSQYGSTESLESTVALDEKGHRIKIFRRKHKSKKIKEENESENGKSSKSSLNRSLSKKFKRLGGLLDEAFHKKDKEKHHKNEGKTTTLDVKDSKSGFPWLRNENDDGKPPRSPFTRRKNESKKNRHSTIIECESPPRERKDFVKKPRPVSAYADIGYTEPLPELPEVVARRQIRHHSADDGIPIKVPTGNEGLELDGKVYDGDSSDSTDKPVPGISLIKYSDQPVPMSVTPVVASAGDISVEDSLQKAVRQDSVTEQEAEASLDLPDGSIRMSQVVAKVDTKLSQKTKQAPKTGIIINDKLGSLAKDHGKAAQKKDKEEKPEDPPLDALTSAEASGQMVQRCVVIQRDERGYGLTVSGDNPVFVQSVKENGAAARAGVQKGDRIIKVNGTLVTNSNHVEVVALIRSGSYVALTLLGRPPGKGGTTTPTGAVTSQTPDPALISPSSPLMEHAGGSERITGPQPVDAQQDQEYKTQKIATIRMMYEKAANEYEMVKRDLAKNPSASLLQSHLNDVGKILRRLEQELFEHTGIPAESQLGPLGQSRPAPPMGLPPAGPSLPPIAPSSASHATSSEHLANRSLSSHHTPPHHPQHLRRFNSGDNLHHISDHDTPETPHNPAPWLPDGPKHRKADSMPEYFYHQPESVPHDATVTRSHSDSRKRPQNVYSSEMREGASTEEIEKLRGDLKVRRRLMMKKTSSLPSSMYETGQTTELSSPLHSLGTSPPPVGGWVEPEPDYSSPNDSSNLETPKRLPTGSSLSPSPDSRPPLQVVSPNQVNVISYEDEEFSSADDDLKKPKHRRRGTVQNPPALILSASSSQQLEEHGPFSDLNNLKHKPAHLAVFLHYLISNSDPSPLFFYLVTESYSQGNMKEMRKWAYEIHSTFLVEKAPLRVNVDDQTVSNIDNVLHFKFDKEDSLRGIFQMARHIAQNEISELLADFRNKRSLGLGSLYGDHELQDENMDRQNELKIIEKYLVPHFEHLMECEESSDRNQAMASALATFLKQVSVQLSSKNSAALDRCQSFVARDRKMFRFPSKSNKKVNTVKNHQFMAQQYFVVTFCAHCQGVMWGIGNQGYQCINCEINVHKSCQERLKEVCHGVKRKRDPHRKSVLEKIGGGISRKQSHTNPAAIKEATRWQEEGGSANPPTSSVFHVNVNRGSTKEEDAEDESVEEALSSSQDQHHDDRNKHERDVEHFVTVRPRKKIQRANIINRRSTFYGGATLPEDDEEETEDALTKADSFTRSPARPDRTIGDESLSPSHDSRSPENPADNDDQKKPSINLSRSESLNKKRENRKNVRRTRSDVLVDEHTLKALNQSGSSSNSSIPGSLESPSNSHELLNDVQQSSNSSSSQRIVTNDDSDFETEGELPPLDASIPKEKLKKLKPKEKKRQEVINELFHTERAHVRNLKVMARVFFYPMKDTEWISNDLCQLLFNNIEGLIQSHDALNTAFKAKRKEDCIVGDFAELLLDRFQGEAGEDFQKQCAIFCQNQSHALEVLRTKIRKDQNFAKFMQEASANPLCRRLELKDLMPTGMQRLTKYPLLIENLMKYTGTNTDEHKKLAQALACSKSILAYVNQAVADCENRQKLHDIQRRLDLRPIINSSNTAVSEFKNLNLPDHKLVFDGSLTWRVTRQKVLELHVLLLEDILVLLQKQDDKLILKCQSTTVVAGKEDTKFTHSPIIKLTNLITRNMATDKRAFFLVSTSSMGPQLYELAALSMEEKNRWFRYISEASEAFKFKEHRRAGIRPQTAPASSDSSHPGYAADKMKNAKDIGESGMLDHVGLYGHGGSGGSAAAGGGTDRVVSDAGVDYNIHHKSSVESMDSVKAAEMLTNQSELIQPNEVVVSDAVLEHAEPVLTPLEKLMRKDKLVQDALRDKQELVAKVLGMDVEEYETIADMASEIEGEKEPREIVLASIHQAQMLAGLLNSGLRINSENETPPAAGGDSSTEVLPGASAGVHDGKSSIMMTLPSRKLHHIATQINKQMTQLLDIVSNQDVERCRLEHELKLANEQLLLLRETPPTPASSTTSNRAHSSHDNNANSRPNSFISVASSTSDLGDVMEVTDTIPMFRLSTEEVESEMPLPPLPTVELVQHNPEDLSVDKFEVIEVPAPEVMDDSETKELTNGNQDRRDEEHQQRREREESDSSDEEDSDDDDVDDDDDDESDTEEGFVDARTDSDSNLLIMSLASSVTPEDESESLRLSEDTDS